MFHSTQKDNTMNDHAGGGRPRRRRLPRWAGFLAVAAGIALLTAACGGSGAAAASPSSTQEKLVAYARCMRAHGVPNFPDPDANGAFNGNGLNRQSPQFQAAQNHCASLSPFGNSGPNQAQNRAQALKLAQCMRAHGVPNYPDPNSDGAFHFSHTSGINPQSPAYLKAQRDCQSIMSAPGLGQSSGG